MEEAQTVAQSSHGLNGVDILVILLMIGSGLFAMVRGFVKEGFVLVSLICGALAATKFYPVLQPWMREQIENSLTADITTWLSIFILTLVIFIPITSLVVSKVQGTAMTTIDRSLGFVFGALRGALIACLLYLLAAQFWDKPKDTPYWIKEAKTRPLLEAGASLIKDLVPIQPSKDRRDDSEEASPADEKVQDAKDKAKDFLDRLTLPKPELNKDQPGYDEKARQHLDELIEKKSEP